MLDINGTQITSTGTTMNFAGLNFSSAGYGTASVPPPGLGGSKNTSDYYQSVANTAWPLNNNMYDTGHSSSGAFTCPIAGIYLCSASGIANGFGSNGTHGYAGFSKNNVNTVYMHWNMSTTNGWTCGGTAMLLSCAAGDVIRFHVNNAPLANYNAGVAQGALANPGYGWFNQGHHQIFIVRVS